MTNVERRGSFCTDLDDLSKYGGLMSLSDPWLWALVSFALLLPEFIIWSFTPKKSRSGTVMVTVILVTASTAFVLVAYAASAVLDGQPPTRAGRLNLDLFQFVFDLFQNLI